jgi:hypothetical protein
MRRNVRINCVKAVGNGAKVSRGKIYKIINTDVEIKKSVIVFQDCDAWFAINRLRDQIIKEKSLIGILICERFMVNIIAKKS